MTIRPKGFTTLSGLTRLAVSRRHRTARMAVTKSLRAMAKQMMEISTSKTVSNNLGNYNSRTFQGKAWTQREYEFENEKGLPGRQYGVRDWSRASLNFEVVKGQHGQPIVQPINHSKLLLQDRWQKRIDEGYTATVQTKKGVFKKPIKKSEIKMVMIDFGGNRDRMHELAFDRKVNLGKRGIGTNGDVQRRSDIEQWAVDCYEWAAKKYGAENIIDFVVHLDETNPHIHCIIVPLTRDGKLSYTELFGGSREQAKARSKEDGHSPNYRKGISDYLLALHTDFANTVGDKWGLERGDDIKITGNTHKSTAESLKEHNKLEEEIEKKSGSVLTLTNRQTELQGKIENLEEASRRADETLTAKNKLLSKMGVQIVRPTLEIEDENEQLKAEKEKVLAVARQEKEKAATATQMAKKAYSDGAAAERMKDIAYDSNGKPMLHKNGEPWTNKGLRTWYSKQHKEDSDKVKQLTKQVDEGRVLHNAFIKALLSIPIIKAAVEAIMWAFGYDQAFKNWGFSESRVKTIGAALDLADGVDKRKQLANTLVDLAHADFQNAAQTTVDKVNGEIGKIADGTHKHLTQGQGESVGLHK